MDTITHGLLGALVVRAAFPAGGSKQPLGNRQRMIAGAIAGAFPDIDYVASWVDPMVYLTLWHRSITHSIILLPLWALLLGGVLALAFHQRKGWIFISLLTAAALGAHILSDLITVYGTQVLAPLSGWRASIGTTFIIDPWFTLMVLAGLVAGWRKENPVLPRISLGILLGYVGIQGMLKSQAFSLAEDYMARQNLHGASATALPQPFSPFHWKMIIQAGDRYHVSYVNLAGAYPVQKNAGGFWAQVAQTYRGGDDLSWQHYERYGDDIFSAKQVRELWENRQLDYFRRFAAFPVLHRVDRSPGEICVWFTDLRYVLPYMTPPFRYGLCRRQPQSDWWLNRLRPSQN